MKSRFSTGTISDRDLAAMCGGELWRSAGDDCRFSGICTDSREADAETVFVALRGERVDGHDYISAVLEAGCRCILCEHRTDALENSDVSVILVRESECALATLASSFKAGISAKTVAVTGSVGKTTTKEMTAAVLSCRFHTYRTEGNYNSVIGMPLTVLQIPAETDYAVLEMGMSGFGEIERMSATAEPEIAIITNIGTSHLEKLGTRENICRAKLEILCGLKRDGILLLNGDEPLLENVRGKSYRTLYVSTFRENADFFAKNIRVEPGRTLFDVCYDGRTVTDLCVRVMGRHNVYAALFAFATGILSGMTEEEIRAGLLLFEATGMRQHLIHVGSITLIEDCYNAAPESMNAAIDVLDEYCSRIAGRSIAVLGDMRELGEDSPALHRMVGKHLAEKRISNLFTIGKDGYQIAVGARQAGMSPSHIVKNKEIEEYESLCEEILAELEPGDVILIKASRAVGAERIAEYLKDHLESENQTI